MCAPLLLLSYLSTASHALVLRRKRSFPSAIILSMRNDRTGAAYVRIGTAATVCGYANSNNNKKRCVCESLRYGGRFAKGGRYAFYPYHYIRAVLPPFFFCFPSPFPTAFTLYRQSCVCVTLNILGKKNFTKDERNIARTQANVLFSG